MCKATLRVFGIVDPEQHRQFQDRIRLTIQERPALAVKMPLFPVRSQDRRRIVFRSKGNQNKTNLRLQLSR